MIPTSFSNQQEIHKTLTVLVLGFIPDMYMDSVVYSQYFVYIKAI